MTMSPKDLLIRQFRTASLARVELYGRGVRDPTPFFLAVLQVLSILSEYPELAGEVAAHQLLDDYYAIVMLLLATLPKTEWRTLVMQCSEAEEISRMAKDLGVYGCDFSDRATEVFRYILEQPESEDLHEVALQGMHYLHSPKTKSFIPRSP